jgi:hypothetical protein
VRSSSLDKQHATGISSAISSLVQKLWAISFFRLVSGEPHGGHSLPNSTRDIKNCTAEERGRGTPWNVVRIDGSDIPDDAVALAADLGTGELLLQFFGDEMIFVPELHNSQV